MLAMFINVLLSVRKNGKITLIILAPTLAPCSPTFFISLSFSIAPRKAAVKTDKPDKNEGEKKTSVERKTSAEEGKDTKG